MSTEDHPDTAPPDAPASEVSNSEAEAWAEVCAAWSDEAVHRRYLARFHSLEALAVAGSRYRVVLAERPDDAMALQMRAEILKKATAYGLAALPRTPAEPPRSARRMRLALAVVAGAAAVWAIVALAAVLLGGWS